MLNHATECLASNSQRMHLARFQTPLFVCNKSISPGAMAQDIPAPSFASWTVVNCTLLEAFLMHSIFLTTGSFLRYFNSSQYLRVAMFKFIVCTRLWSGPCTSLFSKTDESLLIKLVAISKLFLVCVNLSFALNQLVSFESRLWLCASKLKNQMSALFS